MIIWTLAKKEFRLLLRDRLSAAILLGMPLLFILILGLLLGEGFGQKPDDRLRVSVVDLDAGHYDVVRPDELPFAYTESVALLGGQGPGPLLAAATLTARREVHHNRHPFGPWSRVVIRDLRETAGIRVEVISTYEEAVQLRDEGKRAAIVVFYPEFSARMSECSFLREGTNPFHRDGVLFQRVGAGLLRDDTQLTAASV